MSDLGPFVAAVLRDKVMMEQSETIADLKAQLDASREVEVTGHNGVPIYARGSFQNGKFGDRWDAQWLVGLEMDTPALHENNVDTNRYYHSSSKSMSLRDLSNIEIRIGGILFASSSEVEGTTPSGLEGINANRIVTFLFGVQGRDAWLTFCIPGLPKEPWISLKSTALYNMELSRGVERRNIYEMISNRTARSYPNQTVEIKSVSFGAESVRKMIASLRRGPAFEEEKLERFGRK